jgi:hypothetical protein
MKKTSIFRNPYLKILVFSLVALSLIFTGVALAGWGGGGRSAGPWSPEGDIGMRHIDMADMFDISSCLGCHSNDPSIEPVNYMAGPLTPPSLDGFRKVDMGGDRPCSRCHGDNIFTTFMGDGLRCSDCHDVGDRDGDRDGYRDGGGRGGWGR